MNREVVITRGAIVSAVGTLVALLAVFGVGITHSQQEQLVDVLVIAMPIVLPLLGAVWARAHVTPVFDPQAADGTPLVPAGQVSPRQDVLDDTAADDVDDEALVSALASLDDHSDDG